MPATLDVSCPNCGKQLKVPAELEGKRVKCKDCQEVFAVTAPKKAGKPAASRPPAPRPAAARPAPKTPAPPKPEEKPRSPFLDDDDEDVEPGKAARPMGVIEEEDVPRCPHCAKELDPPDAVVCKSCGFNNRTRVKAETRKVVAADASDWMHHLGPAILLLIVCIVLIVVDIYCAVNMRGWLEGSDLELDEVDLTGRKKMVVPPGAFIAFIIAISAAIIVPAGRYALRRLIFEYKPQEKVK